MSAIPPAADLDQVEPALLFNRYVIILAGEAIDQANGSREDAIEHLAARVLGDDAFFRDHIGTIVRLWAADALRAVIKHQRYSIVREASAPRPPTVNGAMMRAAMADKSTRLMDFPIWGGKRLGDATVAEVRASAEEYRSFEKDYGRKARWLSAVADAAEKNGGDFVRDALPETTLDQLFKEAFNGD